MPLNLPVWPDYRRGLCMCCPRYSVPYPMIPAGSALHEMIRRPGKNPLIESPED